jgi:hypothetical protein
MIGIMGEDPSFKDYVNRYRELAGALGRKMPRPERIREAFSNRVPVEEAVAALPLDPDATHRP